MPFSVDLCLTNSGNTLLGPTFLVFSDTNPNVPFTTINLSDIVQSECPYVLSGVPNNTTSIKLLNLPTGCCIEIPISENLDLCVMCDLGFDIYSANTVSVITAGNLTGSCDNSITDYVVNWYGPDSSTIPEFTSGIGSVFSYDWEHPLTGTSSIFTPPGVYTPEIESVILNGVTLEETEGVLSDCFLPITVEPFNCSNGTNPNINYNHKLEFSNSSQGNVPPNLSAVFVLTSTTEYFAYAFEAEDISDTLKITYSGSNYSEPLVIEYITMGDLPGFTSNYDANTFPKSGNSQYYITKVLCLTGLTYDNGDYLIIEVEPNQTITLTDWTLYFSCLDTFDCFKCINSNTPYKIIESSITGITGNCDVITINFKISGCSANENDNDVINYMTGQGAGVNAIGVRYYPDIPVGGYFYSSQNLYYSAISCGLYATNILPDGCNDGNYSIYYRSWRPSVNSRQIEIKFQNLDDFTAYTSNFYSAIVNSGSTNPFSIDYYRALICKLPTQGSLGPNGCGDGTQFIDFYLHPATVQFVTGNTIESPFLYTINISASTITDQVNYGECLLNCNSTVDNSIVDQINNTMQSSFYDLTGMTTVSLRKDYPFPFTYYIVQQPTSATTTSTSGQLNITEYSNITYIASGNPLVNITSLSAQTCDFSKNMAKRTDSGAVTLVQYVYDYQIVLDNPSDVRDFSIYASPISGGAYNGFPSTHIYSQLVYKISGGTVTDTNYFYLI